MAARLAAVAAAVAMIAAAIVVRDRVIDGDPAGGGRDGNAVSICAVELPDGVCDGERRVAETFTQLESTLDDEVVWITPGPWPSMLDAARGAKGSPRFFERTQTLASTELVAVVFRTPPQCTAGLTWQCLGDAARAGEPISAPAVDTPTRLLVRAALVGGRLGRADYASNDLTDDPEASTWISEVERAIEMRRSFSGAGDLSNFLAVRGAGGSVFLTTAAEAKAAGARSASIVVPEPRARVAAVAGISRGAVPKGAEDRLREGGWKVPADSGGDDGLPSPGVLLALREITS